MTTLLCTDTCTCAYLMGPMKQVYPLAVHFQYPVSAISHQYLASIL